MVTHISHKLFRRIQACKCTLLSADHTNPTQVHSRSQLVTNLSALILSCPRLANVLPCLSILPAAYSFGYSQQEERSKTVRVGSTLNSRRRCKTSDRFCFHTLTVFASCSVSAANAAAQSIRAVDVSSTTKKNNQ